VNKCEHHLRDEMMSIGDGFATSCLKRVAWELIGNCDAALLWTCSQLVRELGRLSQEVLDQAESCLLAFLRVKLGGEELAAADGAGKADAFILGAHGDERLILRFREVGVDEVEEGRGAESVPFGIRFVGGDGGIPAHVRDFAAVFGEAADGAGEDSETGNTGGFFSGFEEQLVSDADAKKGFVCGDPLPDWFVEAAAGEFGHAIAKSADAGKDDVGESFEAFWCGKHKRFHAEALDGVGDAAKVSGAVVDDAHFHGGLRGLPWCLELL
jgi:hypothetical protein